MKKLLSSSFVRNILGIAIFIGLMVLSTIYFSLGDVIISTIGIDTYGMMGAAIAGAIDGALAAIIAMIIIVILKGLVGVEEEKEEE